MLAAFIEGRLRDVEETLLVELSGALEVTEAFRADTDVFGDVALDTTVLRVLLQLRERFKCDT